MNVTITYEAWTETAHGLEFICDTEGRAPLRSVTLSTTQVTPESWKGTAGTREERRIWKRTGVIGPTVHAAWHGLRIDPAALAQIPDWGSFPNANGLREYVSIEHLYGTSAGPGWAGHV